MAAFIVLNGVSIFLLVCSMFCPWIFMHTLVYDAHYSMFWASFSKPSEGLGMVVTAIGNVAGDWACPQGDASPKCVQFHNLFKESKSYHKLLTKCAPVLSNLIDFKQIYIGMCFVFCAILVMVVVLVWSLYAFHVARKHSDKNLENKIMSCLYIVGSFHVGILIFWIILELDQFRPGVMMDLNYMWNLFVGPSFGFYLNILASVCYFGAIFAARRSDGQDAGDENAEGQAGDEEFNKKKFVMVSVVPLNLIVFAGVIYCLLDSHWRISVDVPIGIRSLSPLSTSFDYGGIFKSDIAKSCSATCGADANKGLNTNKAAKQMSSASLVELFQRDGMRHWRSKHSTIETEVSTSGSGDVSMSELHTWDVQAMIQTISQALGCGCKKVIGANAVSVKNYDMASVFNGLNGSFGVHFYVGVLVVFLLVVSIIASVLACVLSIMGVGKENDPESFVSRISLGVVQSVGFVCSLLGLISFYFGTLSFDIMDPFTMFTKVAGLTGGLKASTGLGFILLFSLTVLQATLVVIGFYASGSDESGDGDAAKGI